MTKKIHKVIIVGSGPAGLTAGIYIARANLKPLLIEGAKPGGQLMTTTKVENWPGQASIMGPQLMIDMIAQTKEQGVEFITGSAVRCDLSQQPFKIFTDKNKELLCHSLIIATGATPKRLNCPGEEKYWGKGVTTCAVCDGAFYKDVPVVIVGGGDTAMEDAQFMANLTNDITIVHILDKFTASKAMQKNVVDNPKYKIIYSSTVTEIHGDDKITHVTITDQKTGKEKRLPTQAVFLAIGHTPNTDFLKGQVDLNEYGYLLLNDYTKTSVPGVFGAGDVHDFRYRQAVTAAGAGCMAALDAERYLSSK